MLVAPFTGPYGHTKNALLCMQYQINTILQNNVRVMYHVVEMLYISGRMVILRRRAREILCMQRTIAGRIRCKPL